LIYRIAILGTILIAGGGFTVPASAAGHRASIFKGTCSSGELTSQPHTYGTFSESDGVQTGAANGMMATKDYFALMKRAKAAHLTLGADGFLWATQQLHCDSISIVQMDDYKGHTMVTFSDGDPNNPVLGFAGGLVGGDGPLFFSSTIYLADGRAMPLNSDGSGHGCHFYFADHGTFTQGWETRLTAVECDLRVKTQTGHLISADVTFNVTQTPVSHPSRDSASDHP
jgi:hypothetical protein